MKKFNYISSAKKTFKIESEAINNLSKQIDKDFVSLCDAIRLNDGKFIIMGVGKSGHIGQKISATLSSTGTGSIFIHPTEAAHGDLGLIRKKDIVFLISNSGETDEIINILPSLKRLTRKITSLTSNKKSTIAKASDIGIVLKSKEACPLDLAPTSSTTAALAFGDALAIALLESKGFTKKDFASSHPAGKLGKKLITQVKHLMHSGKDIPKVGINTLLSDALIEITDKSLGITLVKNRSKVVGIFKDVMTKKFITIEDEALAIDAAEIMESNKVFTLAVMKKDKNVGVISMHDLIQARIL
jgi:arabinose-5-phosphate isomerase